MANIKSQIKRNKQNLVRHERNKAVRSELKSRSRSAVAAAEAGADDADGVELIGLRRVDLRVAGGDQREHPVVAEHVVDELDRALLADGERRERVGEGDGVAEREGLGVEAAPVAPQEAGVVEAECEDPVAGAAQVVVDEVGNVIATPPGSTDVQSVILSAHLDTVFPAETPLEVRKNGVRIQAPGISDNARGLAAMIAIARVVQEQHLRTRLPVAFVATVGEEGLGDLRGVKHLFRAGSPYRSAAAFISLVQMGLAPAWMVVVIVGREFAVMGLRMVAVEKGVTIPASPLGKGKMATQVAAILLLILGHKSIGPLAALGPLMLWLTTLLALVSGLDYFLRFYRKVASSDEPAQSQA